MARRVSRRSHEQILIQTWWVRAVLALAFLLIAYGFASLAIDSGSLFEYALTIACVWYGVLNIIRSFKIAVS